MQCRLVSAGNLTSLCPSCSKSINTERTKASVSSVFCLFLVTESAEKKVPSNWYPSSFYWPQPERAKNAHFGMA